jgi:hypothetical protein
MKQGTWKWILAVLVAAFVAAASGAYFGFSLGFRTVLNEALQKDARDVDQSLATLKALRTDNRDQALENVEAHVDDTLILFDPAEPFHGLSPETTAAIDKAIRDAADYRAANPRKSRRTQVDAMVTNLLSRAKK